MVSSWCLGGVSAASMLIQGVHGVLVVSWRHRVGGVGAVALVVLGCVSVVFPCASPKSNLEYVFVISRTCRTMHQVVFSGCMLLSW